MSRTATMLLDLTPVAVTLGIVLMRMGSHALVLIFERKLTFQINFDCHIIQILMSVLKELKNVRSTVTTQLAVMSATVLDPAIDFTRMESLVKVSHHTWI